MTKSVRTRFAPSPTGYLHVGGARTAFLNWLFARHHGGQFILRIEDTDLERSTDASVDAIFAGMEWLGLDYDEGPFYQTRRFDRYRAVVDQLVSAGHAYRCYCTKERLDTLRTEQQLQKIKPRYDRCCLGAAHRVNQPYVVRFLNPQEGVVTFEDSIYGTITIQNDELDDLIIARSDGVPTYNLTVVVDDWDMNISHVIRGDDHINNTPRQINILNALGAELPIYAHVPMILGSDGKRLSKRHGAVSVLQYEQEGILPEALLNYLVRLGWSHGDQEIFSRAELVECFNLNAVNRSPAAFNRDKLLWLNQHYMKTLPVSQVASCLRKHVVAPKNNISTEILEKIVPLQAERTKTLVEMATASAYFFENVAGYELRAAVKHLRPEILPALRAMREYLVAVPDAQWQAAVIHSGIMAVATEQQLSLGQLAQPLRVAMTGGTVSPPIDATMEVIGRGCVLARLDAALIFIEQQS